MNTSHTVHETHNDKRLDVEKRSCDGNVDFHSASPADYQHKVFHSVRTTERGMLAASTFVVQHCTFLVWDTFCCWPGSVYLSRSCIVSRWLKISSNLFCGRVAHSGFLTLSTGTFSGSLKYTRVGQICGFRLKLPLISETVQDKPLVATER